SRRLANDGTADQVRDAVEHDPDGGFDRRGRGHDLKRLHSVVCTGPLQTSGSQQGDLSPGEDQGPVGGGRYHGALAMAGLAHRGVRLAHRATWSQPWATAITNGG